MVIGSINVNSLLLHIDEVRELIKDKGFHILAVNETKLDSTIADSLLGVDGYAMHKQDRDRHGGGVAVYVRDSLKHHRRRDISEEGLEFISIEVKPTKTLPFLVAAWYRTPSDPIESFTKLEGILEFFDHENKETILLGDTNCDMYLLENSPENSTNNVHAAVHMASIYDTFGLTQLIQDPTRETLDTATLIDHVASTHPENITESEVLKVALSDRYAIYCIRKYGHIQATTENYHHKENEKFR